MFYVLKIPVVIARVICFNFQYLKKVNAALFILKFFHTVDHSTLLKHLKKCFTIKVLQKFYYI